jgi:hypothetical protein
MTGRWPSGTPCCTQRAQGASRGAVPVVMAAEAEQAEAAKKRGAVHFLKKTTEGYQQALAEYSAAIELVRSSVAPSALPRRRRCVSKF